ncbi:hypothetical protein Ahy_A02g005983 [Arachis hypogaea]|uniref:Uncharacterized protein n=1 Tax=Arachis hypogaea TaxID=3818 RepID=A0A445E8G0_ARAHY|nr:hypothetical protein Ahy_A02g005983 [Arachis hypogaea]
MRRKRKMLIEKHIFNNNLNRWAFKISNVWFAHSKFPTLQYMWSNSIAAEAYASIPFSFKWLTGDIIVKYLSQLNYFLSFEKSFLVAFFGPLFHYVEKMSHVHVQETIIIAWTIRHPTRNSNDPIARAKFYQQRYILPDQISFWELFILFEYSIQLFAILHSPNVLSYENTHYFTTNLILFSRIPNEKTLEEPPTPTINLSVCMFWFSFLLLRNVSHRFRYKKLSLPPRQLDI